MSLALKIGDQAGKAPRVFHPQCLAPKPLCLGFVDGDQIHSIESTDHHMEIRKSPNLCPVPTGNSTGTRCLGPERHDMTVWIDMDRAMNECTPARGTPSNSSLQS